VAVPVVINPPALKLVILSSAASRPAGWVVSGGFQGLDEQLGRGQPKSDSSSNWRGSALIIHLSNSLTPAGWSPPQVEHVADLEVHAVDGRAAAFTSWTSRRRLDHDGLKSGSDLLGQGGGV